MSVKGKIYKLVGRTPISGDQTEYRYALDRSRDECDRAELVGLGFGQFDEAVQLAVALSVPPQSSDETGGPRELVYVIPDSQHLEKFIATPYVIGDLDEWTRVIFFESKLLEQLFSSQAFRSLSKEAQQKLMEQALYPYNQSIDRLLRDSKGEVSNFIVQVSEYYSRSGDSPTYPVSYKVKARGADDFVLAGTQAYITVPDITYSDLPEAIKGKGPMMEICDAEGVVYYIPLIAIGGITPFTAPDDLSSLTDGFK